MECLLHRDSRSSNDDVVPFTELTFAKVQECCKAWKATTSSQDIAIAHDFECAVLERVEYYGYHINCYNMFTRKGRIAKARLAARKAATRHLRSSSSVVERREAPEDAFPPECAFCRAAARAPLTRCRRPESAAKILAAAQGHEDRLLLDRIAGQDLVARQLAYHSKCYAKYTAAPRQAPEAKYPVLDEAAFRGFAAGVATEEREGRRCVPVTALAELFLGTAVDDREGLRERFVQNAAALKKHCPYRTFSGGKFGNGPAIPWEFGSLDGAAARDDGGEVATEHRDDYSPFAQHFALHLHRKLRDGVRGQGSVPFELPNFLAWCTCEKGSVARMPNERRDRVVAIAHDIAALTAEHAARWK